MKIISRAEAKRLGLKRYFTGKPCRNGHIDERYVNHAAVCISCRQARSHKWRAANRESASKHAYKYRAANRDLLKERSRKYRTANSEQVRKYLVANRERIREVTLKWRAANPERVQKYQRKAKEKISEAMNLLRVMEEREAAHVTA